MTTQNDQEVSAVEALEAYENKYRVLREGLDLFQKMLNNFPELKDTEKWSAYEAILKVANCIDTWAAHMVEHYGSEYLPCDNQADVELYREATRFCQ